MAEGYVIGFYVYYKVTILRNNGEHSGFGAVFLSLSCANTDGFIFDGPTASHTVASSYDFPLTYEGRAYGELYGFTEFKDYSLDIILNVK